jgi:signal transduction histidine kinase
MYLVDQRGQVILRSVTGSGESAALAGVDPALADGLRSSDSGRFEDDRGAERAFASRAVGDAPWRLVLSVPTATLLAPIRGASSWAPWILFGGFALASIAAVGLFVRLFQHRARLAAVNVELGERNDELRELDRLKDEFVALVSHELRTPLTSVIGYLRLLLRDRAGSLEPEQRRLIGIAERNASRLVRLVGDLLFSAKADAGRLDLDAEPVALNEIVLRCLEGAQPPARERGVHVAHAIEPSVVVEADPERIAQVVDNLVSNAIKFTPEGGRVFVGLHVEGDRAVVEVSDSGIGIPEAEVARLFERFFRASTAVDREIQGSGLGLSVAKTIVEAHGGTIGCTSAERKGSVFRVTLPLAQRHSAAA